MKKFKRTLSLILCLLLAGCAAGAEAPHDDGGDAKPDELRVVFWIAGVGFCRQLSTYDGGAYYNPRPHEQGELNDGEPLLLKLNTETLKVEKVNNPLLDYMTEHWFFTDGNYLYVFPGDVMSRSNLDGTGRVDIELPEDAFFRSGVQYIVGDAAGSLYAMFDYRQLIKFDFESGAAETVFTMREGDYGQIVGVSGQTFILSTEDGYKQFTLGQADGLAAYDGPVDLRELYKDLEFFDKYTNTLYVDDNAGSKERAGLAVNYDTGREETIPHDGGLLAEKIGGGMSPSPFKTPKAATEDGFIIEVAQYNSDVYDTMNFPIYGYISKEDYHNGKLANVTLFDYSAIFEESA